jgi:hypothetical protein
MVTQFETVPTRDAIEKQYPHQKYFERLKNKGRFDGVFWSRVLQLYFDGRVSDRICKFYLPDSNRGIQEEVIILQEYVGSITLYVKSLHFSQCREEGGIGAVNTWQNYLRSKSKILRSKPHEDETVSGTVVWLENNQKIIERALKTRDPTRFTPEDLYERKQGPKRRFR